MLLLGIDVGTSSIKVSIIDSATQKNIVSAQYPEVESAIIAEQPGWAEQKPEMWWQHVQEAIKKAIAQGGFKASDIGAMGIAYQMHGLVLVDKDQKVLRNAIIWCDSRAVAIGNEALGAIGEVKCLSNMLNSPGNFTASKLAWVKTHEPECYDRIHKFMLPGDYIGMKLTGEISTSIAALSEGIFWDFKNEEISKDILSYFQFDSSLFPDVLPVFAEHGKLKPDVAAQLGLRAGIPLTYKSGDQPNNALSLNVMNPGEVAATAGTSGVIYGISDQLVYDPASRVNTFAHVNYKIAQQRVGVLLCINGTGIMNRWIKNNFAAGISYAEMNAAGRRVPVGSDGLKVLPFGNGAERMLHNQIVGAHFHDIDLNKHGQAHIFRAAQEGIAFAFRYGLDIMRENGMNPTVIRAGKANLFLSDVFTEAFVNATQVPAELFLNDGSVGAAVGAGIGISVFSSEKEAFSKMEPVKLIEPKQMEIFETLYQEWKQVLERQLQAI